MWWQQAIYWLYQNEQDFSPIASYQQGELFYTVTDHIGTVTDLVSERGHIEYQQHLSLWGEADFRLNRSLQAKNQEPLTCRLRFAGQYADEESGLYYNRHRYYNPAVGQYISPDPIGLLGGFNPYGYVGLPTEWVDFFGLKKCPQIIKNRNGEARQTDGKMGDSGGFSPTKNALSLEQPKSAGGI